MGKFTEWIKEHKKSVAVFAGVGVAGIIMYLIHRNSSSNSGSTAPAVISPPSFQGDTSGGGGSGDSGTSTDVSQLQSQIQQLQTALDNSTQHLNDLEAQLTAMNQADSQTIAGLKQQYQAAQDQVKSLQTQLSQAQTSLQSMTVGYKQTNPNANTFSQTNWAPVVVDTSKATTTLTAGPGGNWDAATASNPKNTFVPQSNGKVMFYDSYGVPMEISQNVAKQMGWKG